MISLPNVSPEDTNHIEEVMHAHGFDSLKPTQEQAFKEGILRQDNHLLVAETGNGKTLCAEALVNKRLSEGKQVAYLVPSRQLVRDKKETVNQWVSEDITVASGNGKYHAGDVIVATFNSFYQAILRGVGRSRSVDLAVLDDFHELYGSFIGPELEKAIAAAMHENTELFGMSATIGNPMEIANWLDATLTISNESRSIPIREEVVPVGQQSKKDRVADLVSSQRDEAPFLVFNYAKSWTESRAEEISNRGGFGQMTPDEDMLSGMRQKVDGALPDKLEELAEMMNHGVAYHHSDLPRAVREWIEDLYYNQSLGCICATTTIAYGFDAPVQTVVVSDMKRRGQWVGKWEYQQWIGRAARPGFGYDEGLAYVLSNEPRTVSSEFFEPRELEPIETHVDSPERFRKLLLELIEMGWDEPETIEKFIQQTLYWSQLQGNGAWGRSFGSRGERVERKLRDTADWLEQNGFIREEQTAERFNTTNAGSSTVEFLFDAQRSHSLTDVRTMLEWLNRQGKVEKLPLLGTVTDTFGLGLSERTASVEIEQIITEAELPLSKGSITAAVLHAHWAQNMQTGEIETRADVNAAYLPSTAYAVSDTLQATQHLVETSDVLLPDWFESYTYRVQRGVRRSELPLVKNVYGMGRNRVRTLREYLSSSAVPFSSEIPEASLWEQLTAFRESVGDDSQVVDVLNSNVSGFGPKLSQRVVDFHKNNTVSSKFTSEIEQDNSGPTTLGDF